MRTVAERVTIPSRWTAKPRELSAATQELVGIFGPRSRPNLAWLCRLLDRDMGEVSGVLEELGDALEVEREIARTLASTGRTYYAQFPAPLELYAIVRLLQPEHLVESGVSSGLSTAHMLMGVQKNRKGILHSMDLPQYQRAASRIRGEFSWSIPRGKDSGWAIPAHLKRRWDLRQGRSEDLLPPLCRELPRIDLYCHDSPRTPQHLAFEFNGIRTSLRPGSVVVADNTDHNPGATEALARTFGTHVLRRGRSSLIGMRVP